MKVHEKSTVLREDDAETGHCVFSHMCTDEYLRPSVLALGNMSISASVSTNDHLTLYAGNSELKALCLIYCWELLGHLVLIGSFSGRNVLRLIFVLLSNTR